MLTNLWSLKLKVSTDVHFRFKWKLRYCTHALIWNSKFSCYVFFYKKILMSLNFFIQLNSAESKDLIKIPLILSRFRYLLTTLQLYLDLNTQYMTNSTLVCPVKIEYLTKNNIFGLKMMMKSGLEKIILKFLHAQAIYY